jgi:EAL domain-containing protein (putative c-di-GMP-specific phosphodiesterase class I)
VERQQLSLRYQPILSLGDGVIVGLEALARWRHPTRGPINPATFIAIAEESGAIVSMGRWVLGEACRQLSTWKRLLPAGHPLYVSVNVSPRELWEEDFFDQVFNALHLHGLGPDNLRLEIAESSIMRNREQTIMAMRRLSALGVGISIDDFGTGYSTLSYIKDLPVDTLKIDRTFIAELASGGKNAQLVRTILELGQNLQLSVVAEGIETAEQERMLMELSCRFGQGYHYFEPLTAVEVEATMLLGAQPTKTTG